ncbi:alpha/beta hydrolase [Yinghuangia sp. ASG 101]|uniref:alpha/beta fold hydrolase n=1 Tax=Yinghuangia sp. ASG 101 TaxID=2896848 RepID=UPI001E30A351|nr:alpha/beta hydrolase [Yinghuangia sp. ASG 101]UGQ11304.1 alpha/beta hydrolase [Yinghuangia sp. ASG 101]
MEEVTFPLPRAGITVRGQRSSTRGGMPTLCLHGWLDNSAGFEPLAEHLGGLDLTAVDLPGHGASDPVPSPTCQYVDYVACVLELAQTQGWERFRLIGHSLGGALASLIAGIHPHKIDRLVLIDAIGPLSTSGEESRASVQRYLDAYLGDDRQPIYRTRAQAVKARVQLADILLDTAERLVERDLREVPGGFTWRGDVRLKFPTVRSFAEDQVLAFLRNISAPTLLVTAERSALLEAFYPQRITSVPRLRHVTLPGGHHLHMENVAAVADVIRTFLETD